MNLFEVKNIIIPEGNVTKIEKDGVVLWQSGYQPKLYPMKPLYIHKNENNTWDWVGWNIDRVNYGSKPTYLGTTTIPLKNTAWNGIGYLVGNNVYGGQAVRFTFPKAWTGKTINNLLFNNYNQANTRVQLMDKNLSAAYSSEKAISAATSSGQWVEIPLNDTAKNYFATDHPEGVSFTLKATYHSTNNPDRTYDTWILAQYNGEEAPVFWFN